MNLLFQKLFFYSLLIIAGLGCSEPKKSDTKSNSQDSLTLITTGSLLVPALEKIDSIAVLYYKNPFEEEEERYTRYYTQLNTATDSLISLLKSNMAQPFQEDTLRKCRSEGKIFCFEKGKPVQVIYFSKQNEVCHHLYFIHVGRYYYFKPDPAFETRLRKMKNQSVEP